MVICKSSNTGGINAQEERLGLHRKRPGLGSHGHVLGSGPPYRGREIHLFWGMAFHRPRNYEGGKDVRDNEERVGNVQFAFLTMMLIGLVFAIASIAYT